MNIQAKNILRDTIESIRIVFQDKRSYTIAALSAVLIGYAYYWLLNQVTTLDAFSRMAANGEFGQYSGLYAALYWITTIATAALFGVSAAVLVWLWRRSRLSKTSGISNLSGAFVGALGSACPVCGAFLLALLGVSSGVAAFPFNGLELKFAGLALIVGSTAYAARTVKRVYQQECADCVVPQQATQTRLVVIRPENVASIVLAGVLLLNQILIGQAATAMGMQRASVARMFGISTASAQTVIAPQLNPDGKTTSLVEQPAITEVPGNPNTGDPVADARAVMIPTGKPFYAPDDISFDDPINAQNKWGAFEKSIQLSGDLQNRYDQLINTFTCNYCCGGPTRVTPVGRCGCRHAKAWRGMFKYMLQNYGDQYTNEQLMGEAYRWTGIWYPKGVLEDYLLVTGYGAALPHQTHGGAGADGNHGLVP